MNRTARRVVGVAACALALTATAATAHAETQTHDDPKGDVQFLAPLKAAQKKRSIDIINVTNRYSGNTLTAIIQTTHLANNRYAASFDIRSDSGDYRALYNQAGGQPVITFFERDGGGATCEGLSIIAKREKDQIVAKVPSSCFGDDDSIQVAETTERIVADGSSRIDDARRDGYPQPGIFEPIYGPELQRN